MDSESAYTSEDVLDFAAQRGYKIEFTAPRDKHAGGIAERMVGLVTSRTNSAMMKYGAPPSFGAGRCSKQLTFLISITMQKSRHPLTTLPLAITSVSIIYTASSLNAIWLFPYMNGNISYLLTGHNDAVSLPTLTLLF